MSITLGPSIGWTDSAVTPGRTTQLRLDIPETAQTQFPISISRRGNSLMRAGFGATNSLHTYKLLSGAISLRLIAIKTIRQTLVTRTIVPLTDWNVGSLVTASNTWRAPTDLPGVVTAGVQATGDSFYQKSPGAGASWNDTTNAADVSAFPRPAAILPEIPLERGHVGKVTYPPEQGFIIRVDESENSHIATTDFLGVWYFGGPVSARGDGQFAVALSGGGIAHLWEHIPSIPTGDGWTVVDEWQYAPVSAIPGHMIVMHVHPHTDANGHSFIQFESEQAGGVASVGLFTQYFAPNVDVGAHLYKVRNRATLPNTPPLTGGLTIAATGSGVMRIEMPQNKRTRHQVALFKFNASGYAVDGYFQLPFGASGSTPVTLFWDASTPMGADGTPTSVDVKLFDADTDVELTVVLTGANSKVYQLNPLQPNYYAIIYLTASTDGSKSPYFWGYGVQRDGVQSTTPVTEIDLPDTYPLAAVRDVSITGPESDPSHETASCEIEDTAGNLNVLNIRTLVRSQIRTRYDLSDRTKFSVLFDGYATRQDADRKGTVGAQGSNGSGAPRAYPSPEWRSFAARFLGMWTRLERNLSFFPLLPLMQDRNAPKDSTGGQPPYKVTDVVRFLLGCCGFSDSQIDVPDSPMRFFNSPGGYSAEQLIIEPLAKIAGLCTSYLRDFLGWYLVWDGNAGTAGMWRAITPSIAPYINLANFTTDAPSGKLPHRPESYGTPNWVGVNPTVIIRRGTLKTVVDAPEANAVCVTATGQILPSNDGQFKQSNWMVNLDSYDAIDGFSTADPTNPDYIGFVSPLVYVNTALGGAGDPGQIQLAVDTVCRRLFDLSCHAIKRTTFDAPLALIIDPGDSKQVNPRPLRYFDPVTITSGGVVSQWLVRNCNPHYKKDSMQMATYELEAPRF